MLIELGAMSQTKASTGDEDATPSVLSLTWDDLECGALLGTGSFANVYRVKPLNDNLLMLKRPFTGKHAADCDEADDVTANTSPCGSDRSVMGITQRFALKTLNHEMLKMCDPRMNKCMAAGLQFEAEVLSKLSCSHENIITLFAVSTSMEQDPTKGFLVLERLNETLGERLKRWRIRRTVEHSHQSLLHRLRRYHDKDQNTRTNHIGLSIAKAVAFLHKNKILYRDLKPENVGFDDHGSVKLFDFGLARKLEDCSRNDCRRLTFQVGSLRYMSPECAQGQEYGFSTDVYSFAILLWEIITLEKPFSKAQNEQQLTKMAYVSHQRPSLKMVQSRETRSLLKAAWDPIPQQRPTFAPIVAHLRAQSIDRNTAVTI